jgi:hypothetical protein
MHHVLIRDDELGQYRRIREGDNLEVCFDGDLYRVVSDPSRFVCLLNAADERLCNYPEPHEHDR